MKTSLSFLSLSLIILFSTNSFANLSQEQERVYLHDIKNAKNEYDTYKADKANKVDPFEKVRQGYNSNLNKDIESSIDSLKNSRLRNLLDEQSEAIDTSLSGNSAARQAEKKRLYNLYHTEGYFNKSQYERHMASFNSATALSEGNALRSRTDGMKDVINSSNVDLNESTLTNSSNSKTAANNLISLMNNESVDTKNDIEASLSNTKSKTTLNSNLADNATFYANQWNNNCGSACTLPPPPPPPPTEPDIDPWEDVNTLCWTKNGYYDHLDKSSLNSCDLHIRIKKSEEIIYSVGQVRNATTYSFKDSSDWSAVWSRDCMSTKLTCSKPVMRAENDNRRERVDVRVVYKPTGESRIFSITADIVGQDL